MEEVVLHFTAGSGPQECRWVVAKAAEAFMREATALGMKAKVIGGADSGSKEVDSMLLCLQGADLNAFVGKWIGTIRWIGTSPYRPQHKRKNWYIGVKKAPTVNSVPELNERDVKFQAMRSTGPGGQHVNTTDSAVRATHVPTSTSVVAMEERSQHANKKLALIKLVAAFEAKRETNKQNNRKQTWRQSHQLERGNEIRVFEGAKFREK